MSYTLDQIFGGDVARAALGDPETGGCTLIDHWDASSYTEGENWVGEVNGEEFVPANDPTEVTVDGLPTVRFDGVDQYMTCTFSGGALPVGMQSVLCVPQETGVAYMMDGVSSTAAQRQLLDFSGNNARAYSGAYITSKEDVQAIGVPLLVAAQFGQSGGWLSVNGTGQASGTVASATDDPTGVTLASRLNGTGSHLQFDVAAVILTTGQATRWQVYQLHRWYQSQYGGAWDVLGAGWSWDEHTGAAPNPKELLFAALQPPQARWRAPLADADGHQMLAFCDGESLGAESSVVSSWANAARPGLDPSRTAGTNDPTVAAENGRKCVNFPGGTDIEQRLQVALPVAYDDTALATVARCTSYTRAEKVLAGGGTGAHEPEIAYGARPQLYNANTLHLSAQYGVGDREEWFAAWGYADAANSFGRSATRAGGDGYFVAGNAGGGQTTSGITIGGSDEDGDTTELWTGRVAAAIVTAAIGTDSLGPTPYQCAVLDGYLAYVGNAVNGSAVYPDPWGTDGAFDWRAVSFLPVVDTNTLDMSPQTRSATSGEVETWADIRSRFNAWGEESGQGLPTASGEGLLFETNDALHAADTDLDTPDDMTWCWVTTYDGTELRLAAKYGGSQRYFRLTGAGDFNAFDNASSITFGLTIPDSPSTPLVIVLTHESAGGSYRLFIDGVESGTPSGTVAHNGTINHDEIRKTGSGDGDTIYAHARWDEVLSDDDIARLSEGLSAFDEPLAAPSAGAAAVKFCARFLPCRELRVAMK